MGRVGIQKVGIGLGISSRGVNSCSGVGQSFNGDDQYLEYETASVFDINNTSRFWALSAKIKTGSDISTRQRIIGKLGSVSTGRYCIQIESAYMYFLYTTSSTTYYSNNCALQANTEYHFFILLDLLNGKQYNYFNGVLQNTGGTSFAGTFQDCAYRFRIGKMANGLNAFTGSVRDVRIFHSDVSADINKIIDGEIQGNELAWWCLSDGKFNDLSGNGYDLGFFLYHNIGILGDSTEAGVGIGGTFGQTDRLSQMGGQMAWIVDAILNSSRFISIETNRVPDVFSAIPYLKLDDPVNESYQVNTPTGRLTIYYMVETDDDAASVDVDVNGSGFTLNSYRVSLAADGPYRRYGIATHTVTNGASVQNITFSNMTGGIRFCLIGFADGKGITPNNWSVSSTTLLDESAANIDRGVTTQERVQKIIDGNCDIVCVGWGTNDSKSGVRPEGETGITQFKQDAYDLVIAPLRAFKENVIIIWNTDPAGEEGSFYENNVVYNQAIREICSENDLVLADIEVLFNSHPEYYYDTVHPNQDGYNAIKNLYKELLNITQ